MAESRNAYHVSSLGRMEPSSTWLTSLAFGYARRSRRVTASRSSSGSVVASRAWASDEIAALDYVFANRFRFNIAAVNVSIGDGGDNVNQCTGSWFVNAISNLRSAGIATVVAAGNDSHPHGLSEAACVPGAVSVGAVNSADQVPSWSNSTI